MIIHSKKQLKPLYKNDFYFNGFLVFTELASERVRRESEEEKLFIAPSRALSLAGEISTQVKLYENSEVRAIMF